MKKKLLFILSCILVAFTACDNGNEEPPGPTNPIFEEKDHLYIEYKNNTVTTNKKIEGVTVTINEADIEINSKAEGIKYTLTGNTTNGSFKISSDDLFELSLDGVDMKKTDAPVISIQSEGVAIISLKEGTKSVLQDGYSYSASEEDMKGTINSKGQIDIYGPGEVTIIGNCKHGIASKTHIRIIDECTINVLSAASDAIHSKYDVYVKAGLLNLTSTNEGIESKSGKIEITNGEIKITTEGEKSDGLKAETGITIENGVIEITTEGEASKCVKTDGDIVISGGKITLTTKGDAIFDETDTSSSSGLRSKGNISIENAEVIMNSSGDGGKGMSADKDITITSGTVAITTTGDQYVYNANYTSSPKAMKSEGSTTIKGGKLSIITIGIAGEGIDSKGRLTIEGGKVRAECYDDCLKVSSTFTMTDGYVYCNSETNDGVDVNSNISISGGQIIAIGGQNSGNTREGFNCGKNNFVINGGIVIGIGGKSSTPTSGGTQYSVLYKGNLSEKEIIRIESEEKGITTYQIPKTYRSNSGSSNSATFLISTPDFSEGETYKIYKGGTVTGGTEKDGYFSGEFTYSSGNEIQSFTITKLVTEL